MPPELTLEQQRKTIFSNLAPGDTALYTPQAQKALSAKVPTLRPTPAIISSKDLAGQFNSDSVALDKKALPPPSQPTETASKQTAIDKGAVTTGTEGQTPSTGTTGDAIYDSLQVWEQKRTADIEVKAAEQKAQYEALYTNAFAAVDSTYSATLQDINTTFDARLVEQKRINQLSIDRTKAYGLSTGNALTVPIEFTNAVTEREQEAAGHIKTLENERNSFIARARAARDSGNAELLRAHMDDINKVEDRMREQIASVAEAANTQYKTLVEIRKDQEAKQKEAAQAMLAAAAVQYGEEFYQNDDPAVKDALIKKIIAQSGGILDYGTVLSSLYAQSDRLQKTEQQNFENNLDLSKFNLDSDKFAHDQEMDFSKLDLDMEKFTHEQQMDLKNFDLNSAKFTYEQKGLDHRAGHLA